MPLGVSMRILEIQRNRIATLKRSRAEFLKEFGRDEEGGIIILSILLLITMLVVGGMAVDFMRFESERAQLQSVADRATLSAASLDQTLDGKDVIVDFFEKAGYGDNIVGEPEVRKTPGSGTSFVKVNSEIDVDTFYLRLVGIDTLTAPATSSAIQGGGSVEVSLVLDISGSMRNEVNVLEPKIDDGTGEPVLNDDGTVQMETVSRSKMYLLQAAASQFIDDLLIDEFKDEISINLIAYSQQVALDDDLYRALRTTPDTISSTGVIGSTFGAITDGYSSDDNYGAIPDDPDAPVEISWAGGVDLGDGVEVFTNPSRCIDFAKEDFESTEFDLEQVYNQVEYFEHYSSGDSGIDFPVCPQEEFESILLLSQDKEELKRRINLYRPTSYTSIHLGVKWGISLLDPTFRPVLAEIDSIDDAFQGDRPTDFSGDTLKYLVVMTDGVNVASRRIETEHYNTYEWRKIWAEYPMDYWRNNIATTSYTRGDLTDNPDSATEFNTWMETLCNKAKPNMTIYTIAMGAGSGATQIAKCASQPSYAFSTNFNSAEGEPGIDEIFQTIAQRIKELRLNL